MFEKKDALPCAEHKIAIINRNDLTGAGEGHAQMAGTIVRPLIGVDEVRKVFRNEVIEEGMKIGARFGVSVLHYDKAGTGVLNKNCDLTIDDASFVNKIPYLPRDFVGSFAV